MRPGCRNGYSYSRRQLSSWSSHRPASWAATASLPGSTSGATYSVSSPKRWSALRSTNAMPPEPCTRQAGAPGKHGVYACTLATVIELANTRGASMMEATIPVNPAGLPMGFNIKNEEAQHLATELAALTGETLTRAVIVALRERIERLG